LIFEGIVLVRLAGIARRSKWKGDDVIIKSLGGVTFIAFLLAGLYGALMTFPAFFPIIDFELIRKAFIVFVLFLATVYTSRITCGFVMLYSGGVEGLKTSLTLFTNVTKLIVYLIGGMVIIQFLGVSIAPILTALGVGGLAVALALQDTLSNLFAGIQILASRQIAPGEYVKLASGEEGIVDDISWRNTTIKTLQNNVIVIPNSKLATTILTNFSKPSGEVNFSVGIGAGYSCALEKVESIALETAKNVMNEIEGGVPEFDPVVRFREFGDSSIDFDVIMQAKSFNEQYKLRHEFLKRLKNRFEEKGIEIPYPARTVFLKGMNQSKKRTGISGCRPQAPET
jgi:small-conductance mechanosensitive channel